MLILPLSALVALLVLQCCSSSSENDKESSLRAGWHSQTARLEYVFENEHSDLLLQIHFDYTNPTDQIVYLPGCRNDEPEFILEKREGDEWKEVYGPICQSEKDFEVGPGETFNGTVTILHASGPHALPKMWVDPPFDGEYRIDHLLRYRRDAGGRDDPERLLL